jgi:hypothetical protein
VENPSVRKQHRRRHNTKRRIKKKNKNMKEQGNGAGDTQKQHHTLERREKSILRRD